MPQPRKPVTPAKDPSSKLRTDGLNAIAPSGKPAAPPDDAYSYLRWSSLPQGEGDSARRQDELRDAWLAKSGAVLNTSLTLRDEGVSAFTGSHRQNPDRHALAAFLDLVKRGRIRRGSYLIVESLDRLSREHIRPALTLLLNLIDAGIRVVQLLPVEAVYDEHVEPMQLMMAIMELSRGNSESVMKSERVGRAWAQKKAEDAAVSKEPITKRVPAWLCVEGGRFVVDEEKADAVRRVYRLAIGGSGIGIIVKRLNAEGVQPIATHKRAAPHWAHSTIAKLLGNRATFGEYQPHTRRGGGKRRPDGKPVPGYFPSIITEDQWHAAQAALASRRGTGGPASPRVNLFQGLLYDARDGSKLHVCDKGQSNGRCSGPSYVSSKAALGVPGSKYASFPVATFERAVLEKLREIDPREILPGNGAAEKVLTLTGQRAAAEARLEQVKAQLIDGDDDAGPVAEAARALRVKIDRLAEELAQAQREAASPLSAAWGEAKSLLDVLDGSDARLRLRAALRRVVEGIRVLIVPRGQTRLCGVQVWFRGARKGERRDYLILHRAAWANGRGASRPGCWWCRSLAEVAGPEDLDLRKREHARQLEAVLMAVDLQSL